MTGDDKNLLSVSNMYKVLSGPDFSVSKIKEMSLLDEEIERDASYSLLLEQVAADLGDTRSAVSDVLLLLLSAQTKREAENILGDKRLDEVGFYELIHECGVSLRRAIRSRHAGGAGVFVWDEKGVTYQDDIVATNDELAQTVAMVHSVGRDLAEAVISWSQKAARELPCLFAGLETSPLGADMVTLSLIKNTHPNPKERWGHFLHLQSQR